MFDWLTPHSSSNEDICGYIMLIHVFSLTESHVGISLDLLVPENIKGNSQMAFDFLQAAQCLQQLILFLIQLLPKTRLIQRLCGEGRLFI